MVGRFVQQEYIRILQQQSRQFRAHAPAAGKFFERLLQLIDCEGQSEENCFGAGFTFVTAQPFELVLQATVAFAPILRRALVIFGIIFQFCHFLLDVTEVGVAMDHALQHSTPHCLEFLRQHGGACAFAQNDLATVQLLLIHNGAEERGFSHTVFADQADTLLRPQVKRDVIEQHLGTELFFEIL